MAFFLFKPFIRFGSYTKTAVKTETGKAVRLFLKIFLHSTRILSSLILGFTLWTIINMVYYTIVGAPEPPVAVPDDQPLTLAEFVDMLTFIVSLAVAVWITYCLLMAPTAWLREKLGLEEEKLKTDDFTKQLQGGHEDVVPDVGH